MKSHQPITDISQVIENMHTFNREIDNPKLRSMIAYVRHWYAVQDTGKGWIFAPSKFIGYAGMTSRDYDPQSYSGSETENNLKHLFIELDQSNKLHALLLQQVRQLTARHGKKLNSLARIHVLKGEGGVREFATASRESESWRITSNPEILSGKPCIRGIRIRVADILDMLAEGATRNEILEDYAYLEDQDITAALEYAKSAVDHRLVKAA